MNTTTAADVVARNNVTVSGRGTQPMLFAHGFGCDQHMWRFVAPAFEDDYRVVLFDYVGSGGSDLAAYDPARYATLDVYAIDDPPGYVGGFQRADIEGLLETMDRNYIGWANFLAPAIMKNPDRPELGEELTASFCSTDPVIARRFAEATFFADNRADLPAVRVPSLILQCSDDMIAPTSVGEYLARELPGSTLRLMRATGHCPQMSAPDETIRLITEYLRDARAA